MTEPMTDEQRLRQDLTKPETYTGWTRAELISEVVQLHAAMTEQEQIDALAYSLADTFNACKFADLTEEDRQRYFERAAVLLQWLNNRNVGLSPV